MIWKASLQTRHFLFEAYGPTDESARERLIAACEEHATQFKLTPEWWEDFIDDIQSFEIELGQAYRDGQPL